ncbi:hypothetical protein FB451DRAFT_1275659 [Mycena latifolia]|nr:hypothetical protein FB451DRAFT_1275659 [Mycena latifolia]
MDNNKKTVYTRSAVRSGHHPAPAPLFSPQALAFGTVEAGATDIPSLASAMGSAAFKAARPSSASAEVRLATPVARSPSPAASSDGGFSSGLPILTMSNLDVGAAIESPTMDQDVDEGWTPVTSKTSHSHRERGSSNRSVHTVNSSASASSTSGSESESGTESTVAKATEDLSHSELEAIMRRHEQIAEQFRTRLARKAAPSAKVGSLGSSGSINEPKPVLQPASVPAPKSRGVMGKEFEDESDLISFSPVAGPSNPKGKGPDPRNWGGISDFDAFSEEELNAQREMLANGFLVDFAHVPASTPKAKKSGKRSRRRPLL